MAQAAPGVPRRADHMQLLDYLPLQIRLGRTQVPVLDNLLAIEQHRPVVCTA